MNENNKNNRKTNAHENSRGYAPLPPAPQNKKTTRTRDHEATKLRAWSLLLKPSWGPPGGPPGGVLGLPWELLEASWGPLARPGLPVGLLGRGGSGGRKYRKNHVFSRILQGFRGGAGDPPKFWGPAPGR